MYSQYGEERVLRKFFGERKNGLVVDIGAMDGVTFSNSRDLIINYKWRGLLVEPHLPYFNKLESLYVDNKNVVCKNVCCFNENKVVDFYVFSDGNDSCISTISEEFKDRASKIHGDKYHEPIKINAYKLSDLLVGFEDVDFLSIDCEGVDLEVLKSNNWNKIRPPLICIEHSMSLSSLDKLMSTIGYKFYDKTGGNSFYESNI